MPLIKMNLSIGYAGADRNDEEYIDDEEWEAMTEKERNQLLDELSTDWANNFIEIAAWVEEE